MCRIICWTHVGSVPALGRFRPCSRLASGVSTAASSILAASKAVGSQVCWNLAHKPSLVNQCCPSIAALHAASEVSGMQAHATMQWVCSATITASVRRTRARLCVKAMLRSGRSFL